MIVRRNPEATQFLQIHVTKLISSYSFNFGFISLSLPTLPTPLPSLYLSFPSSSLFLLLFPSHPKGIIIKWSKVSGWFYIMDPDCFTPQAACPLGAIHQQLGLPEECSSCQNILQLSWTTGKQPQVCNAHLHSKELCWGEWKKCIRGSCQETSSYADIGPVISKQGNGVICCMGPFWWLGAGFPLVSSVYPQCPGEPSLWDGIQLLRQGPETGARTGSFYKSNHWVIFRRWIFF